MAKNQKDKVSTPAKQTKDQMMGLVQFIKESHDFSYYVNERLKNLLRDKNMTFNELAEKLDITANGLYLSFKRNKVTLSTIEKISEVLNVHPYYFFENAVIDRLTTEVSKYKNNPDLKSFLLGFSRDVAKGMELEKATFKSLDAEGFNNSLIS